MKKSLITASLAVLVMVGTAGTAGTAMANDGYVSGKIVQVHAGPDNWYGVRFHIDATQDSTGERCTSAFVYTEPEDGSGHTAKVSLFMAAYLAGKNVTMTVTKGRNGYCKIFEGFIHD